MFCVLHALSNFCSLLFSFCGPVCSQMAFKAPVLRVLKKKKKHFPCLCLSSWPSLETTWTNCFSCLFSVSPLCLVVFPPLSFSLSCAACLSGPLLSSSLSSAGILFWLAGPQELAPRPRPEWKLAQVAVKARPGKMEAGEGGAVGGDEVALFAHNLWLSLTHHLWASGSMHLLFLPSSALSLPFNSTQQMR